MGESEDNVVLRLLREIRADTQDTRHRVTRLERHIEEMREQMKRTWGRGLWPWA